MITPSTRKVFASTLVDCWVRETNMATMLNRAMIDSELEIEDAKERREFLQTVFKVSYIKFDMPVRAFVATNYRKLSECMWGGGNRDTSIAYAIKSLGGRQIKQTDQMFSAKIQDKRSDWSTCK